MTQNRDDIEIISHNPFGIAFYWKTENTTNKEKIQLVFKDTGLLFSCTQIKLFYDCIIQSLLISSCTSCSESKFLVQTPISELNFALDIQEISALEDLLKHVQFSVELDHLLF